MLNSGDVLVLHGVRPNVNHGLFLAVKSSGNFAQPRKRSGLLPAGLEGPGEDLLKMIAVIHRSMKKNHVGALVRPG